MTHESIRFPAGTQGIKLTNDVAAGQLLTWDDVTICEEDETYQYRRRMEEEFGSS
ncbi:MAG: hypothetical protein ACKJSG_17230 [Lentisphaeria bacterium]